MKKMYCDMCGAEIPPFTYAFKGASIIWEDTGYTVSIEGNAPESLREKRDVCFMCIKEFNKILLGGKQ